MTDRACGKCEWFWKDVMGNFGGCVRYPKKINKRVDDWCGEFKEKVE